MTQPTWKGWLLLVALTMLISGCVQPISDEPAAPNVDAAGPDGQLDDPTVVRIGWNGLIDTWNPVATQALTTYQMHYLLYDALYQLELDGSYTPELVKSAQVSDDGRTWTFAIRDGFSFSDGVPLTANDVAFSFNLYMAEPDSLLNPYTEAFESVEAVDERTVVITLADAIPNMESQLIRLHVLPEHIWRQHADDVMAFDNLDVIGSGAFSLSEARDDGTIVLAANPDHPLYPPGVAGAEIRAFDDPAEIADALLAGQLDMITGFASDDEDALQAADNIAVVDGPPIDPDVQDIIFNLATPESCPPEDGICSGHPALLDRTVRLALAHATDKQRIIDETQNGYGAPGITLIPDSFGHWYNSSLVDYAYDVATANRLLDEAGYLDTDGDGVRDMPDGSRPLRLRVNWEGEPGETHDMEQLLTEMWQEVGIATEPEALDFDTLLGVCCPGFDFDIILWGWGSDPDPSFLLSLMTTEAIPTGMSETAYSNPEYDALYAQQAITLDLDERRDLVWRMQEIVHNDIVYLIPYYTQNVQAFATDRFHGWVTDGGALELLDISSLSRIEPVE